jgi:hypothetical protein
MELQEESLRGAVLSFSIKPTNRQKYDLEIFVTQLTEVVLATLHRQFVLHNQLKFQLAIHVSLVKDEYDIDGESIKRYVDPYFLTESYIYEEGDALTDYNEMSRTLTAKFDAFVQTGSGFTLDEILDFRLKIHRFRSLQGGRRRNNTLPDYIARKRACLCIKSVGNLCFIYACLAALHTPSSNTNRASAYTKHIEELNTANLVYPVSLAGVKLFEKQNRNISVNVLGYEGGKVKTFIPLYRTRNKRTAASHQINLLLHNKHYHLITSMSRLLNRTRSKKYFCHGCLCSYRTKDRLDSHYALCRDNLQALAVPDSSKQTIKFTNFKNTFSVPFVIYYDIEAMLVADGSKKNHVPISICTFTKCTVEKHSSGPTVFTGEQCITDFLSHVKREESRIVTLLITHHSNINWDDEDDERLERTTVCDVCKVPFGDDTPKYRDHDHLKDTPGESNARFITCNRCNLTFGKQRTNGKIPVLAHNGTKYDVHHIVQALKESKNVTILARNSESIIALYWGLRLVFIDSLAFMVGSLTSLVTQLPEAAIKRYTSYITDKPHLQQLLEDKGVFPYDHLDSATRLEETTLPSIDKFHDTLHNRDISARDYQRAKRVWAAFECKNLRDYLELYVKLDTVLLAAVVEAYRESTRKHFELDPLHYITAPSLCWDAMLKMTSVTLEMLPSVDMYLFFAKGIRGGICGTSTRYAKANNVYCKKKYDPSQPINYILSLDCNNLYGHSLSQWLPTGGFRWLSKEELQHFDVSKVPSNGDRGYFLEVDLHYPRELHHEHNEFPLAPEHGDVPRSEWSYHTRNLADQLGLKHQSSGKKLMLTLRDKNRYIVHHETLKLYVRLGLRVTAIHRGVSFNQSPFMEAYIQYNTEARKKATSTFDIALYKGYNNFIFGKTCYNVFREKKHTLVDDDKKFQRLAARPTFNSAHVINSQTTMVEMKPAVILCNKPVYIGCTVLELSKALMYRFYYDFLLPKYYRTGLRMLYADTDSFYVQISNIKNIYSDMQRNSTMFDTSAYPPHHFLYSDLHKREIGLMKDIHGSEGHVTEFIALRSKMYAVRVQSWHDSENDDQYTVKAKGIHHSVMTEIPFSAYLHTLTTNSLVRHSFHRIQSKRHRLATVENKKAGLCSYDDKRLLLTCGIHGYAYGHYLGHVSECDVCKS